MAAFSYSHHPVLLDPIFLPTNSSSIIKNNNNNSSSSNNMCGIPDQGNLAEFFSISHHHVHGIPIEISSCSTKVALSSDYHDHDHDHEPSVTINKHSTDSSTVVDNNKLESGEQVTQKVTVTATPTPPMESRKRRNRYGSSSNSSHQFKDICGRGKKQKNCNEKDKDIEKNQKPNRNEEGKKGQEEPPTGYIHVRARRGQATDSHSLAERVRREKISERMKMLQRLVPGCEKVTGKALMLDEIINYVQSLQNQVEFLSMKLASLNPMLYDFGMDLDAFLVRPEGLNNLASQIPSVPQCSQIQPTAGAFAGADNTAAQAANFNVTADGYPLLDNSVSLLLQGLRPSAFSNEDGTLLWDVEDQRQSFLNPSGFSNLCSFN